MEPSAPPSDLARHRRGGRRRKADAERRDIRIQVRFSPQEREKAKAIIAPTGLSLSEFMRKAFDGTIKIVVSQTAPPEMLRQLRMMGYGVDQLLHEARRAPEALPALEAAALSALNAIDAELEMALHGSQC